MRGIVYDAKFFRAEIERLTLFLAQGVGSEERKLLNRKLESAKEHLAELEGK
jgi:hypothetical protein